MNGTKIESKIRKLILLSGERVSLDKQLENNDQFLERLERKNKVYQQFLASSRYESITKNHLLDKETIKGTTPSSITQDYFSFCGEVLMIKYHHPQPEYVICCRSGFLNYTQEELSDRILRAMPKQYVNPDGVEKLRNYKRTLISRRNRLSTQLGDLHLQMSQVPLYKFLEKRALKKEIDSVANKMQEIDSSLKELTDEEIKLLNENETKYLAATLTLQERLKAVVQDEKSQSKILEKMEELTKENEALNAKLIRVKEKEEEIIAQIISSKEDVEALKIALNNSKLSPLEAAIAEKLLNGAGKVTIKRK